MILKLMEMKFKAFVLMTISFIVLMVLFSLKESVEWVLGWGPPAAWPPPGETVEAGLARELRQLGEGWAGPPAHPRVPVMLWWQPFTGDDGLQQCGDHQCFFTNDRAYRHHPMLRTIFFYGTDFRPTDLPLPRSSTEDWALFHEESPKNNPIFSHAAMMDQFNHTATFRRGSDLPLTTQYLEDLAMITEPRFLIPVDVKNRMVREGLAPVAYVQSGCDTPSSRDEWVTSFMEHVPVDSYGACLHNKDLPEELQGSEKMEEVEYLNLLAKYKFVIAIENAVCDDYVTEKLWRSLQVGAVPIYLGAPNIEEYLPHPRAALLVKDFGSVREVAEEVLRLHGDDTQYWRHLAHKQLHARGELVPNKLLGEMLAARKWGVTSDQQHSEGNFVKHFQCLVCERVANNVWFTDLGFRALPYGASEDAYGCPVPSSPLTGEVDGSNWWVEQWVRSLYEARALEGIIGENRPFNSSAFHSAVLREAEAAG